jgi:hypothetical protein
VEVNYEEWGNRHRTTTARISIRGGCGRNPIDEEERNSKQPVLIESFERRGSTHIERVFEIIFSYDSDQELT